LEVPRKQPRSSLVALAERPCLIVVTVETTELKLPSRIEAVAEAAAAVAGFVGRSGIDENAAFGIDMAVREAVTNAVLHGNKQDESKFVAVSLKASEASLEIKVHDEGPGFNPELVPDPTEEENLMKTSGRGIFFMRTFMDEVEWLIRPEGGTTVTMLKKF
jgi:serine/threonine-protein kinase RsbW